MNPYPELLCRLGHGEVVQRLVNGHIPQAIDSVRKLHERRAYPPCLLPLFETPGSGPNYTGVLKHWFVDRESTFVRSVVESGYSMWEYARTEQQLVAQILMHQFDSGTPGEQEALDDELLDAAVALGVRNPTQLYHLWNEYEDGMYEQQSLFLDDPPSILSWMDSYNYRGQWPQRSIVPKDLRRYCLIEVDDLFSSWTLHESLMPDWMKSGDQSTRFQEAFAAADFGKCWLIANSRGWQWSSLRKAVEQLVSVSEDQLFIDCMRAWQDVEHECWGSTF